MDTTTGMEQEVFRGRWTRKQVSILLIAAITAFMGTFLISSINVALPAIEHSFGFDAVTLSWVVTSFLLSTAIFLLPVGRWGDLSGIRRIFKAGVIIFTFSSLLCGLASEGWQLIALRFIQGVGAAFTSTTGPAILVSAFAPHHRGRVLGISVSAVYIGLAVGPFAGGMLTQYLGWRSIFFVAALLGTVTTFIAFRYLGKDEVKEAAVHKLEFKGTLFYMAGLVALVYGSSMIPAVYGWLLLAGGVLLLSIFWKIESRSTIPVIDTRLFTHNRLFAFSNLAALINYSATFAIVFLLSLYLQKVRGLSPGDAGMMLMAQPVMMALLSPVAGRLSDAMQPRILTTLGMSMCALGLFVFSWLTAETPFWVIIAVLLWVGAGFALFSSPNMSTIMSSVPRTQYGLASGTAASMRVVGQIVSMTVVTIFLAGILGKEAVETVPSEVFLKALSWAFVSFTIIAMPGIWFSSMRGRLER